MGCDLHLDEAGDECHPTRNRGVWKDARCCSTCRRAVPDRLHCTVCHFKRGTNRPPESTIVERRCNFRRNFACWLHHPNDRSRFDHTLNFGLFDIALCRIHSTDYDQINGATRPSNNDSRRCPSNLWCWLHRRPTSLIMGPWRNSHRHLCLFLCSSHSFHAKNHARNESNWCDEHIVPYR